MRLFFKNKGVRTAVSVLAVIVFLAGLALAQTATQNQPGADSHFTVAANDLQDYPFAVTGEVKDVRLFGTFKATGGRASAVFVLVMSDAQYAKWQKHKSDEPGDDGALYSSGQVSQGTINLRLPDDPANYHVVFNNPFRYPKSIEADLTWQWLSQ